ncbi:MAG: HAD hydrolase-like protein [Geobacter sp.]|nr:HAD hydrolase-like protein [Geobacter sp.]
MAESDLSRIRTLVFDLDGTLYVNRAFGKEILFCADRYIAELKGIGFDEAVALITATRKELNAASGLESSLSATCMALGGDIREMHRRFAVEIDSSCLACDTRVVEILRALAGRFDLYLYTNNNRSLSERVIRAIGVDGIFLKVFTVEENWRPKPDVGTLEMIYRVIGRKPEECLFIGDRFDIDLRLPQQMGSAVFLTRSVEELLKLGPLLKPGESMSENRKEMLDAIMRAMEIEKETFDYYTKAEQKTFNKAGKRMFHWLARTEEQHYLKLTELYKSLDETGRWVFYGGTTITLEPSNPGEHAVGFDTDDREALEIAIEIEKKGIAYYEGLRAKTVDPDGKAMLRTLLDEEKEHLRVIEEKIRL